MGSDLERRLAELEKAGSSSGRCSGCPARDMDLSVYTVEEVDQLQALLLKQVWGPRATGAKASPEDVQAEVANLDADELADLVELVRSRRRGAP